MTPTELIAKWRERSAELRQVVAEHKRDGIHTFAAMAGGRQVEVGKCADELASTLQAQNCETCKFAGAVYEERRVRFERDGYESPGARVCHGLGYVPLTTADGQPFSCSAWAASPPLEETK